MAPTGKLKRYVIACDLWLRHNADDATLQRPRDDAAAHGLFVGFLVITHAPSHEFCESKGAADSRAWIQVQSASE